MNAAGWESSVETAWGKEPVVVPTPSPFSTRQVFDTLVDRADPFRAGTRIDSRSPVRLRTTRGRLAAPGQLLPTMQDTDPHGYADRLAGEQPGDGWLLTARNPFEATFEAWSRLRDRVSALWRRVGWPSVPVQVELAVGHDYRRLVEPEHAVLTWVVDGRLDASRDGADGGWHLRGAAGDLLYWPAGHQVTEHYRDRCTSVRLLIPADPRAALTVVRDALRDTIQPAEAAHALPYLPCPPPAEKDSGTLPAAPLQEIAEVVRETVTAPEFARTLRHQWAARRSAAGLEPAPAPGPASELDWEQRFRVTDDIVTMPDGPAGTVWAVNGHLLPVGGAAAGRLLAALPAGQETDADEVCRRAGAQARNSGVLRLLRAVHRLRGIEVLEETR